MVRLLIKALSWLLVFALTLIGLGIPQDEILLHHLKSPSDEYRTQPLTPAAHQRPSLSVCFPINININRKGQNNSLKMKEECSLESEVSVC